jgi:1-acyl-sn-glycerol-3-phosphate acyltransferase
MMRTEMLRTIWVAFVAILVTIPVGTATAIIGLFRSTSPLIDKLIREVWARSLVRAAGIDLHTENLDVVDPAQRYVLVSNHYSYLDIPCIFVAFPNQPIRFMAKASLFKIPIFGWGLAKSGFIPIDRKNRRTAVKSFELAADRIRKGNTIVIFPEEGRSRERAMRPFQRGAFLLALKSEKPIIPICIDGTYDVMRVGTLKITPHRVTIRAGVEIATLGRSVREKEALAQESRGQIQAMLFPGE